MPWTKVFADKAEFENMFARQGLRCISYRQAIKEAQSQLLEGDGSIFILGEGVDDPNGVFGTTTGLCERFGKDRVMDIPIAENAMTGIAIGAGMAGMKPIFVHMRMDFLPMCMDQLVNHAAKWSYITGGAVNVPLVVRCIIGRGWGSAAQHSQALHSLFIQIPGMKVAAPATPYDAKGILVAAVKDGNPVIIVEHRWVYDYVGYVPEELYNVPIGKGVVRREGKDVTIVAISHMVIESMKAAKIMEKERVDVEVVDPVSLKPLDKEIILNSVKKTGRLIIADVGCGMGGISAEISSIIAEKDPSCLRAPVKRIGLPDAPAPASPELEAAYYPSAEDIAKAIRVTVAASLR